MQATIYLNQLSSAIPTTINHSTASTVSTTTSAAHLTPSNKNQVCNTSPTSTTSVAASASAESNDCANATTDFQQKLMETLIQAGNNANVLNSIANNTFNNNLFNTMANSTNNNFVDSSELLNNSINADTKSFNNVAAIENNPGFEELNADGLTCLINNFINNGGFNNQQWEDFNATAAVLLNSNIDIQQQVNSNASLVKSIKQQPKYTSVAAPSSTGRHSSASGHSSPVPNILEQQLISLFNNMTPAELLSTLSGNNISSNNISTVATAAGLTSSQIANAAAQMFSAVSGNNDISNLIHNATTNGINLGQNSSISNNNSDNNATAAAVASLLAASGGSFGLSRSPSKVNFNLFKLL